MASVMVVATQPKCLQKCSSVYTSTYMYSYLHTYANTFYHSRRREISHSHLTPSHSEHKKNGCSSAREQLTFSLTAAHKRTLTGQQLNRQKAAPHTFTTSASPDSLQGCQLEVYTTVKDHFESNSPPPLRMVVTGTAGTGKSYLIQCIRLLLGDALKVAAPTGVASFIIEGTTLHSLLHLPTRGEFKQQEGNRLQQLQQAMSSIRYIIIDEVSMVGRKVFGQIDNRLRQAFPHHAQEVFGGCSLLLFGEFGQLPPVMDLPLYTTDSQSDLSDQAFTLPQLMRQAGSDPDQVHFKDILLHLRNAEVTKEDR